MRRLVASFVIGILASSFVLPLAQALAPNTIPACCRRDGTHHCMPGMPGSGAFPGGQPAVRAVSCCPYRSQIAIPNVAAALDVSRTAAQYSPSAILPAQTELLVLDSRSHLAVTQRGPPVQLFRA